MHKQFLLSLVLVLVCAVMVFPQDLMLKPYGVSPAEAQRDTVGNPDYLGIKDRISTGLENVGVESKDFLIATLRLASHGRALPLLSPFWSRMTNLPFRLQSCILSFLVPKNR